MIYEWTPPAESYILDTVENENPFSVSVTVSALETTTVDPNTGEETTTTGPAPTGLRVSHELPDMVNVVIDGTTATFSSDTTMGLFPIELDVLETPLSTSTTRLYSWDELTDEMVEITQMIASPETVKEYPIQLTADPLEETVTVYIRVYVNYTINGQILKQEVAKRGFKAT